MLSDGTNSFAFNGEGELASAAGVTYTYDGDGNRVKKSSGKLYWYGGTTDPLSESDASGNLTDEYVFFGGARIARRDASNNMDYYFADQLGSAHVVTNSSGAIQDDSDYYPFGGERSYSSTSGNNYKFTGKERDAESNLDDFEARYYSSSLGRFVLPDEFKGGAIDVFDPVPNPPGPLPYALLSNPQSLNKYVYAFNNPLRYVDPDGHDPIDLIIWISGPNHVTTTGFADAAELGPSQDLHAATLNLNAQVVFSDGDNPSDYKTTRVSFFITPSEANGPNRSGVDENPDKNHISNQGNSKYVYDGPGLKTVGNQTERSLNGGYDAVFKLTATNTKTHVKTDLYYRVQFVVENGKIIEKTVKAGSITKDDYDAAIGADKPKNKKKK